MTERLVCVTIERQTDGQTEILGNFNSPFMLIQNIYVGKLNRVSCKLLIKINILFLIIKVDNICTIAD